MAPGTGRPHHSCRAGPGDLASAKSVPKRAPGPGCARSSRVGQCACLGATRAAWSPCGHLVQLLCPSAWLCSGSLGGRCPHCGRGLPFVVQQQRGSQMGMVQVPATWLAKLWVWLGCPPWLPGLGYSSPSASSRKRAKKKVLPGRSPGARCHPEVSRWQQRPWSSRGWGSSPPSAMPPHVPGPPPTGSAQRVLQLRLGTAHGDARPPQRPVLRSRREAAQPTPAEPEPRTAGARAADPGRPASRPARPPDRDASVSLLKEFIVPELKLLTVI